MDSKANIRQRRNSIDVMASNAATGMELLAAWKQRADQIVIDLFDREFTRAGAPPGSYAFCLAGSGARGEACPYSDLDCFMLVEDESPTSKRYFREVSTKVKTTLEGMDEIAGLRFCFGGLNPLGQPNCAGTPELILPPIEMAGLIENPKIDGHVRGSIGEYRFLFGGGSADKLMEAYKTEANLILVKTCYTFSSRPMLTKMRTEGFEALRSALTYKVPKSDAASWDLKKDFYRLPQFAVKGLRLYYGIDLQNTTAAIAELKRKGKLSDNMAAGLTTLMDVMTELRTKAQLHMGYEFDEVHASASLPPKKGYVLSTGELKKLKEQFFFMHRLHDRVAKFVAAKEAMRGPRGNPFAEN